MAAPENGRLIVHFLLPHASEAWLAVRETETGWALPHGNLSNTEPPVTVCPRLLRQQWDVEVTILLALLHRQQGGSARCVYALENRSPYWQLPPGWR